MTFKTRSTWALIAISMFLIGCGSKPPATPTAPEYYPGMVSENPVIKPIDGNYQVITIGGGKEVGAVDGVATNARFNHPEGLAIAPDGTLYVADTANYLIRKIDPQGNITTLAGSTLGTQDGQGTAASFMGPKDIALDPEGNLFVCDFNRVRKITPSGAVSTLPLKDAQGTPMKYVELFGIVYDQGTLYVSTLHRIDRISLDGTVTTLAGREEEGYADGQGRNAAFNLPRKLTMLGRNIVVADFGNLRLREITLDGVVTTRTFAGTGNLGYVDGPATSALMNFPIGVAAKGDILFVADTYNNAIRQVMPDGRIVTLAGNNTYGYQDGDALYANFAQPSDVEVSPNGWVYVADTGNNGIRAIKPVAP